MATVIDTLLVRLGFLPDPTGARQFENQLGSLTTKVGGFFALLGGLATVNSFVETASQFEQFEVQLTTIQGSAEKAKESLGWISEFAAKTPYEMQQVTDAFVKLQSYGLDPQKNNLLQSIGDMASGMGKDLNQAVEAIADAVNGENERLKEFGIKGSKQGAGFEYTYNINGKEFKKQAANNAQDIQKALQEIMDERFKGGMEAMSKTWKGTLSNLSDTWQMFQLQVMKSGIFDAMKESLNKLMIKIVDNREAINEWAKVIGKNIMHVIGRFQDMGAVVGRWADNLGITAHAGEIVATVLGLIAANLAGLAGVAAASGVMTLAKGFMMLLSPIGLVGTALLILFGIYDDLETFAEGGDSFLISFLQDSPKVVAAIGVLIFWLSALAAQWLALKARSIYSVVAMFVALVPTMWAMATNWIAANMAMIGSSLLTMGTMLLIPLAIAAIVAGIYWLYENWEMVWNGLGEIVANIIGMVTEQWDRFVASIEGGWDSIAQAWDKAKNFVGLGDSDANVNVNQKNTPLSPKFTPTADTVGAKTNNNQISNSGNQTNHFTVSSAQQAADIANRVSNQEHWFAKNAMRTANSGVAQ